MKKFEIGKKYEAVIYGAESEELRHEIEIISRDSYHLVAKVVIEEVGTNYRYTWPESEMSADILTVFNKYTDSYSECINFKTVRPVIIKATYEVK